MQERHQRAVETLRGIVERSRTAGKPGVLVGLLGRAIQSSRSPIMHEREARRLGLDCAYLLVDFDALHLPDAALPDIVVAGAAVGFAGFNVTHPFKQLVIPHLAALSPEAQAIGAVNTIVFGPKGAQGYNTDAWGFAQSFKDEMAGAPLRSVVQFGAGGAGAAVGHSLLSLGVENLILVDSDTARAEALAERLRATSGRNVRSAPDVEQALREADGIVNATPMGMAKYPGLPFPAALLQPRHWVAEIVYFPAETELLRQARGLGCRTLSGIGMAIGQAVRAFELFTGRTPDKAAMAEHFEAAA